MNVLKKILLSALIGLGIATSAQAQLLNVSYDPTRELYKDIDASFTEYWQKKSGQTVTIEASHGGSGAQSRKVADGLEADVVTLALAPDIDSLKDAGLIAANWESRLPSNSTPYTSTIVFLVRKGNPKAIKDWSDLVKGDVQVIVPNPKTSGGARWAYLAAWGYAWKNNNHDEAKTTQFIGELYKHVPVLDSGARGSTTTFVQRKKGDVLLSWENEALLISRESKDKDGFEVVYPPTSILAEPPVAVVDKVVDKKGTRVVAEEYLKFLYTDQGQEIAAKHYYRPRTEAIAKKYADQFPAISTFTVKDLSAGGWRELQSKHFGDGGVFDQIFKR